MEFKKRNNSIDTEVVNRPLTKKEKQSYSKSAVILAPLHSGF
jgi:hypothetical protein